MHAALETRLRPCCVICDSVAMLEQRPELLASVAFAWGVENERNAKGHRTRLCAGHLRFADPLPEHMQAILRAEVEHAAALRLEAREPPVACLVCAAAACQGERPATVAYEGGVLVATLGAPILAGPLLCGKHAERAKRLVTSLLRTRRYEVPTS